MLETNVEYEIRRLTTPRAAAVAGILFGVLFAASLVLIRAAVPEDLSAGIDWAGTGGRQISIALALMPFAGIAFPWSIGVVRDRLGAQEDKFFATVFLGSGLLFLALVFVAMAILGGIVALVKSNLASSLSSEVIYFGRALMFQTSNVYALRMAGVFMISLATVWWRTGILPRWLALITYLLALVLLIGISQSLWITLTFPAWVFLISVYKLVNQGKSRLF